MFTIIDNYLNKITMYRLVLYCLIFLSIITLPLSLLKLLPFSPLEFLYSILILVSVSLITNKTFAWTFDAPTNKESVYITALILALIITPNLSEGFLHYTAFIFWAGAIAMASKYIFAINKKHLFNPVALSVVITSLIINQAASWWVGTIYMFPFVLITGFLIVRKIYRADLVFNFFIASFLSIIIFGMLKGTPPLIIFYNTLFKSSVLFFAFFMLTEPLTTPPTKILRIIYGVMVGVFFIPSFHIGKTFLTPEIALILGNVFSHLVSSKEKLFLKLKEKKIIANDTYEFSFLPDKKFNFTPGQYMEWTLDHSDQDDRGNRRYFTLASSPTETELKISVKFYLKSSSFKNKLLSLNAGDLIIASECAGDFTLPLDKNKKLVFMAGGIGITPFRSMLKY
ncbi:MAG: RnfABCDGE type electron transport complex subunit D [Candidatus Falkowbacteria bacterium]|nr:RnfABCDGE type electron transport complex subunit D [Candidatus Falkowbacteria bacterium]